MGRLITAGIILLALLLILFFSFYLLAIRMPGESFDGSPPELNALQSGTRERLEVHVKELALEIGERNFYLYEKLTEAADYIEKSFVALGYEPESQTFLCLGREVRNIEVAIGSGGSGELVVVGAHYDSARGSPGADDNATGTAALLELARLLAQSRPRHSIRLVAFVNEEPPFFRTENQGSLVYARRLKRQGAAVRAMISLESIGYYSQRKGSQGYPFPLGLFYPSKGDFLGFVGNLGSRSLVRSAISSFRKSAEFPSQGVAAPGFIPGIGWSDHWAFWQMGYRAIMVTDTALFRYPFYHGSEDKPARVDFSSLALVVEGLGAVVADLAGASNR